jgi:hypothetical protein
VRMPVSGPLPYHHGMRVRTHLRCSPIRASAPIFSLTATITRVSQRRRERILSVPRVSPRFALGYLILPLWGGGIGGSLNQIAIRLSQK